METTVYTFEEAVEALRMDSMSIEDAHLYLEQVIDAGPEIVDQPDDHWIFTENDLEIIRAQATYDRNAA